MKQLFIFTAIVTMGVIVSCSASRRAAAQLPAFADTYGKEEQLTDTVLHRLQQENDVVIAAYTQNMSWGVHFDYTILTNKGGLWKSYLYSISGTFAKKQTLFTEMPATNKKAADSILALLNNQALWRSRDNHETCNMQVSDGATSYLLMASPSKVLRLSYYMPEQYQKFCPDSSRQQFISVFNKVQNLAQKVPSQ
ncbi:MAG TPA: hypothetical protein VG738_20700 [Chitinophagaceae bacterium]|nr:hypothetical protein [Chitinophagaceae bacterium]